MNEAGLSRWLCNHLKDQGLFVQRLEVTTGAGVPDLAVLGLTYDSFKYSGWIELKWKTKHIRPEQYVWGLKAQSTGVDVNYVVGSEETLALYSLKDAVKMTKSFKLTDKLYEGPRTKAGVAELLKHLCSHPNGNGMS